MDTHAEQVGGTFVIMVTAGAKLLAHGCNSFGQLGFTGLARVHTPTLIPALAKRRVRSVAVGYGHVLALMDDADEVLAWGRNHNGQLGLGHTESTEGPKKVKLPALGNVRVRSIAAGQAHSLAVYDNGDVYGWGACDFGQLGPVLDLVEIDIKNTSTETEARRVHGWDNESKQSGGAAVASFLGESKTTEEGIESMVKAAWQSRMVLSPMVVSGLRFGRVTRVAQVFCCANQSAALTACGCVFVFGNNDHGQVLRCAIDILHVAMLYASAVLPQCTSRMRRLFKSYI